jgi:integron integrase
VNQRSAAVGQGLYGRAFSLPLHHQPRRRRASRSCSIKSATRSRTRHYSYRTEEAYAGWIKRFILFHGKRHPAEMGPPEITRFLTALAVERHVSASTQNQALAALLFLYKDVLGSDPGWLSDIVRAKRPERLPVVLTRGEVAALLAVLDGNAWLMAMLLYGSGLRLIECLRLRVKDIEFSRNEILVREGKGNKDRVTMLPGPVKDPLMKHLQRVRELHAADLEAGFGRVRLPDALARKYPNADREWAWQWVFPASKICTDPRFGSPCRHHIHESVLQKAIHAAARRAQLAKPVGPHTPVILSSGAYRRTLFRDTSLGSRLRHSHRAGAPRPPRRQDHHDLHPRAQSRRPRRGEPCRPSRGGPAGSRYPAEAGGLSGRWTFDQSSSKWLK